MAKKLSPAGPYKIKENGTCGKYLENICGQSQGIVRIFPRRTEQSDTQHMKKSTYYIKEASKLASLPRSKNVMKRMTANHIAAGNARQRELTAAKLAK